MAATPDTHGCALSIANFTIDDLSLFSPVEQRSGVAVLRRCRMHDLNYTSSTIVTDWDQVCDKAALGSLVFSMLMFGVLFGTFIWAYLADRYGRKPTIFAMKTFQSVS